MMLEKYKWTLSALHGSNGKRKSPSRPSNSSDKLNRNFSFSPIDNDSDKTFLNTARRPTLQKTLEELAASDPAHPADTLKKSNSFLVEPSSRTKNIVSHRIDKIKTQLGIGEENARSITAASFINAYATTRAANSVVQPVMLYVNRLL